MRGALDACEEAVVAPKIEVTIDAQSISVSDNGPGIPAKTVEGVLEFTRRISSREAYVAPDRGAQGSALKTVLTILFVLDGREGRVVVEAADVEHEITIRVHPIRQEPAIDHRTTTSRRTAGTKIRGLWPTDSGSDHPAAGSRDLPGMHRLRLGDPAYTRTGPAADCELRFVPAGAAAAVHLGGSLT